MGGRVYQALSSLESWLPEGNRPLQTYSLPARNALRLLLFYFSEITSGFDRGAECAEAPADEAEMLLVTRARAPERKFLLSQIRQGVETMFSQWWHQFIDRVFSRARGTGCGIHSCSRCCVTTWFMPASCQHDFNSILGLSKTEKGLLDWWKSPAKYPFPMLRSISIKGRPGLRGIKDLSINFNYHLTAVSGKNGCGKTTALALAALGFHSPAGHKPTNARRLPLRGETSTYYTFSDFFFNGPNDPDTTGVEIGWTYDDRKELRIRKRSVAKAASRLPSSPLGAVREAVEAVLNTRQVRAGQATVKPRAFESLTSV
jgi:hypothetical protein